MSDVASKLMNGLVLILVAIAAYVFISQRLQIGPPDDTWFQAQVIDRSEPVLVKFGAEWCGPCRALEKELDQVARNLNGRVAVVRVDVDQHPQLAQHYRVSSIPRLLLFEHGQIVADRVGYADHQQLQSWALAHATSPAAAPARVQFTSDHAPRSSSASHR